MTYLAAYLMLKFIFTRPRSSRERVEQAYKRLREIRARK